MADHRARGGVLTPENCADIAMFVFSRRAIQRCLSELAGVLSPRQLGELVSRLNQTGGGRLAASWEACLLHSLSLVGSVSHEVMVSSGRKPDVTFSYPGEDKIGFIADITVISDQGLHDANPVRDLFDELASLARGIGIDPNHLRCEVQGRRDGPYGYQKTNLLLPPQGHLANFLAPRVLPFLEEIRDKGLRKHQILIEEAEVSFTVSFDASQRFMGGGYPSYDVAYSRKKNPLWNRLVSKATQLEPAASLGQVGIMVCDGGCALLSDRIPGPDTFTVAQIMHQFFVENPFMGFVHLLGVHKSSPASHKQEYSIRSEIYIPGDDAASSRLGKTLVAAVAGLPKPILDPLNAYHRSRETGYGAGHHGGYKMAGTSVTISSRAIQELLAGRITAVEFDELHNWRPVNMRGNQHANPFDRCLSQGRMIKRISVEADENGSDDWVTIEFGEPDPAISPFVVPNRSKAPK